MQKKEQINYIGIVKFIDLVSFEVVYEHKVDYDSIYTIAFSADSRYMAVGGNSASASISLWLLMPDLIFDDKQRISN